MNITFNGIWRMDWGFGNPNLTAALLVCLFCVSWLPAWLSRTGFWFSLPFSTAFGICLIHTMSRGGILGGIVSVAVLAACTPRPWPSGRLVAAIAAFWIVILATFMLSAHERLGQGIGSEDKSISHRLDIWKAAPQMLAVSPLGWGWNEAGQAYSDWFQSAHRQETYGSLVNTHLSKVVELGVILGSVYLFLWAASLLASWPSIQARWRAIPFALLLGFGVAATFTNMARHWPLWILPLLAVAASAVSRVWLRDRIALKPLLISLAVCFLVPSGLVLVGKDGVSPALRRENGNFFIGSGSPSLWIVANAESAGEAYRRKVREFAAARPDLSVGLCETVEQLPGNLEVPVLVTTSMDATRAKLLVERGISATFLAPEFSPTDIQTTESFVVVFGEFTKSKYLSEWEQSPHLIKLTGIGDFIPNWPQPLFDIPSQTSSNP